MLDDEVDWEARLAADALTLEGLRPTGPSVAPEDHPGRPTDLVFPPGAPESGASVAGRAPVAGTYTEFFSQPRQLSSEGTLAGLKLAVKDMIEVQGRRVTAGNRAHRAPVAVRDAPAVARLLEQGCELVGMTNLHALAYGATGSSSDWGIARNPQAPGCLPGGSSSGSATAVAEGSADVALGTDTGGSIRIPAALCGVVGFKPTYGAVPSAGSHPLGPSLDHIGPLARDVTTTARCYDVLTGAPEGSSTTRGVEGEVSVGVLGGYFLEALTPEVRTGFARALDALDRAGLRLTPVDLPAARLAPAAQLATLSVEALRTNLDTLRQRGDQLPADVRTRLLLGLARDGATYELAQECRDVWRRELEAALSAHHVLLSPTVVCLPPRVEEHTVRAGDQDLPVQFAMTRLTMPFNLSGNPALSIPYRPQAGDTAIGIQLIGAHGADSDVLRLGAHLEGVLGSAGSG